MLSSKHLKIRRNCKLEAKFLGLFWVLHPIGKQAYKLELSKKWRIYNVFHVFLLEQDTTKKGQVNNTQLDFEFKAGNGDKYKVDGIWNSAVYAKKSAKQLLGLYYLVLWKNYLKEENTWEPALVIQHFQRLVTAYHKNNPKKPSSTFVPVDTALPMARPSAPPMTRPTAAPMKKCGWLAKSTTTTIKQAKKS